MAIRNCVSDESPTERFPTEDAETAVASTGLPMSHRFRSRLLLKARQKRKARAGFLEAYPVRPIGRNPAAGRISSGLACCSATCRSQAFATPCQVGLQWGDTAGSLGLPPGWGGCSSPYPEGPPEFGGRAGPKSQTGVPNPAIPGNRRSARSVGRKAPGLARCRGYPCHSRRVRSRVGFRAAVTLWPEPVGCRAKAASGQVIPGRPTE